MKERDKLEDELYELVQRWGAESTLWALVRTLSTDKIEELISDIKWALGED